MGRRLLVRPGHADAHALQSGDERCHDPVAAYVLHDEKDFYPAGPAGALASYSSRGPRFDGAAGIEIAAPDNPLSTAPPDPKTKDETSVPWEPFGGTSGAGPHVAAAVVLAKQALPGVAADQIKKRLLDAARPEGGTSETTMGHGKLDIARALDADVADGTAPKVKLEPAGEAKLRVTATDDELEGALSARWDLDYDGTFDTDWVPLGEMTIADAVEGVPHAVKVEVRDGQGNVGGATALLEVHAPAAAAPRPPRRTPTTAAAAARRGPIALRSWPSPAPSRSRSPRSPAGAAPETTTRPEAWKSG